MEGPSIAIVRSSRPWARLLHRYVADYGGAVVRARPLEERQALDEEYDILLVDDISSILTNRLVQELHKRRRRILGVYDANEGDAGKKRLQALNVDEVVDASAAPEDLVRLIQVLAPAWDVDQEFEQLVEGMDSPASTGRKDEKRGPRGTVTAVLGTSGGCGATEIALELGRAVRKRKEIGVIVDADELAPAIAQRLGLPLHPNLRAAVDAVEHGTGAIADCLFTTSEGEVTVLVGIPHPRDWVTLRSDEVVAVVDVLASACHHVIVNVAHHVEDLVGLGGADRFGTTRAILAMADSIVLVGAPTPVGVARLLDRVAELVGLAPSTPIHMVLNRMTGGKFKQGEILEEIRRTFTPASLSFVPEDQRVDEAAWQGNLTAAGPFVTATSELAGHVLPVSEGRKRSQPGKPVKGKYLPKSRVV